LKIAIGRRLLPAAVIGHYIPPMNLLLYNPREYLASLVLALLATLSAPSSAQTDHAEAYGQGFVRADASWPAEAAPALPPLPENTDPELPDLLRARVQEMEQRDGPYSANLSESLTELARALDAAGRSADAQAQRDRALHLLRINDGLYSPAQVPLLRDQLYSDRRLGDYESLGRRYDYYFRLFGNGLPPYTSLRFAATLEYQRWQREALRRDLDSDVVRRLSALMALGDDLLEQLQGEGVEPDPQQLVDATLSHLKTLYLLAQLVEARQDSEAWPLGGPRIGNNMDEFNPTRDRLEGQRRGVRSLGDSLLEGLVEDPGDLSRVQRARLLRERADWLLWWGSRTRALDLYRRSWQLLANDGQLALAKQWYAEPRPLPDNGVFVPPDREITGVATLRVTVDERGVASAEFLEERDGLSRDARALPKLLKATRFRPAMNNGSPIASTLEAVRFLAFD
jgi:hypothetical protein